MLKLAAVLVSGVAAGFVAGAVTTSEEPSPGTGPVPVAAYFDETAPVDDRLAALERIVAEERNARLVLEDQITLLLDEIDRIDTAGPEVLAPQISVFQENQERMAEREEMRARAREMSGLTARERQLSRLTDGGFPPERAEQIVDRMSALQWELMQAGYEARNGGTSGFASGLDANPEWRLRQEIGDAEYERYLEAMGRPTEIGIMEVMASSPASRAGLKAGDVIVSYNGTRIFNSNELRTFAMGGEPGTDAVVEIVRDGTPMQLTLPAGPMGIQMGANRSTRAFAPRN